MYNELVGFITKYGYLAIFFMVFSQEIGIPNPIPNELSLMMAGYLSAEGYLFLPWIILIAIFADILGTLILYFLFYFLGSYIIKHKPKWFPISVQSIEKRLNIVLKNKVKYLFIGRLTPFIRGYTSVVAGLLKIRPKIFFPIAIISGTVWSITCILFGRFFGNYLYYFFENLGELRIVFFVFIIIVVLFFIIRRYLKNRIGLKNSSMIS